MSKLERIEQEEIILAQSLISKKFLVAMMILDGIPMATAAKTVELNHKNIADIFFVICKKLNKDLYEKLKRGNYAPTLKSIIENKEGFLAE